MANLQDYAFLCCEDGIYFGKPLKNGSVSKDAKKISKEEIVELFSEILQDHCLRNQTPTMEIERNGKPFIRAQLIIE